MYWLRLAFRNALRHRLRTALTVLGLVVAILSFGLLQTIVDAWYAGANNASPNRLVTRNAVSLTFSMPLAYREKIRAVPGVRAVAAANWFGGIYIDRNDTIYVGDSESGSVSRDSTGQKNRTEWKRGIRIGSARTGQVLAFIPDPAVNPPSTSSAEGVAADAHGVVYGAEVGQKALKRYVKR